MLTVFQKVLGVGILSVGFMSEILACSCTPEAYAPVCQMISGTKVAFVGRSVEYFRTGRFGGNYRFEVEKAYKGLEPDTKEVIVWPGTGTSCSTTYKVGDRFLIFGSRASVEEPSSAITVFAAACSGSRSASPTDEAFLEEYAAGKSPTFVTGRVVQSVESYSFPRYENSSPILGAEVILQSGADRFVERSRVDGTFLFNSIPPGEYSLSSSLNPFSSFLSKKNVVVQKGTCAYVFPELKANSFIEGRVVDARGNPVENLRVRAHRKNLDGEWIQPPKAWTYTKTDGRFRFQDMDSGEYVLGVETYKGGPSDDSPYPSTYFPGVATLAEARIFTVEPQKGVKEINLKLLPAQTPRQVRIKIVNADGKPIGDNLLQLFSRSGLIRNFEKGYNEGREFDSGFSFKAFAERDYVFKARYWIDNLSSDVENKRLLIADPVTLKAGKMPAEVVLRLSKTISENDSEFFEY